MLKLRYVLVALVMSVVCSACLQTEPPEPAFHASFCDTNDLQRLVDEGQDPNEQFGEISLMRIVVLSSDRNPDCLASIMVLVDAGGDFDRDLRDESSTLIFLALSAGASPGLLTYLVEQGLSPCGPISDHVDLESLAMSREIWKDETPLPGTLLEHAEAKASPEGLAEFQQLLENAECAE